MLEDTKPARFATRAGAQRPLMPTNSTYFQTLR